MRTVLEVVRAAIVVTAVPVVIAFHLAAWRPWGIALLLYLLAAIVALLVLNQVLKGEHSIETKNSAESAGNIDSGS